MPSAIESICDKDAYVSYIYQLLECWVNSNSRPHDYPDLTLADWIDVAGSVREDISKDRIPTEERWNLIYTEDCHDCQTHTMLENGRFVCPACGCEKDLRESLKAFGKGGKTI